MAAITYSEDYTSTVSPTRIFKASVVDSHNLVPKLLPQAIKSIEVLQGDGAAGTIKLINFADGSNFGFIKYKIDELDEKALTYKYTVIEGDALADKLEKITTTIKFEELPNGGTLSKVTSEYFPKGDFVPKQEEIKVGKEKAVAMYKAVEAYLLQNPNAYV